MRLADRDKHDLSWHLSWEQFGDSDAASWAIVAVYLCAAWLCLRCWRRRDALIEPRYVRRFGAFWLCLAGAMLLLGLNKQLDLQVVVHELGRQFAIRTGLFESRRIWVPIFVAGLGLFSVAAVAVVFVKMRGLWARVWLAALGLFVLCVFAVERAISFLITPLPLDAELLPGLRINQAFELLGIGLIIGACLCNRARGEKRRTSPQSRANLTD
ncbi:MAG: hypothetical protein ACPGYV_05935 [Phycisphaeraceae bacterium]